MDDVKTVIKIFRQQTQNPNRNGDLKGSACIRSFKKKFSLVKLQRKLLTR